MIIPSTPGHYCLSPPQPPEFDPEEYTGVRLVGELRMKGVEADKIADALNEAGHRTGSKRFGARLFTKNTVTAILHNEFYAAFAPGDDQGDFLDGQFGFCQGLPGEVAWEVQRERRYQALQRR